MPRPGSPRRAARARPPAPIPAGTRAKRPYSARACRTTRRRRSPAERDRGAEDADEQSDRQQAELARVDQQARWHDQRRGADRPKEVHGASSDIVRGNAGDGNHEQHEDDRDQHRAADGGSGNAQVQRCVAQDEGAQDVQEADFDAARASGQQYQPMMASKHFEEQHVEHQRGGGAVQEEVVPLDGGADDRSLATVISRVEVLNRA